MDRLDELRDKINEAWAPLMEKRADYRESARAFGSDLNEAKKLVPHGQWLSWLKENCPQISERSAQQYMAFARGDVDTLKSGSRESYSRSKDEPGADLDVQAEATESLRKARGIKSATVADLDEEAEATETGDDPDELEDELRPEPPVLIPKQSRAKAKKAKKAKKQKKAKLSAEPPEVENSRDVWARYVQGGLSKARQPLVVVRSRFVGLDEDNPDTDDLWLTEGEKDRIIANIEAMEEALMSIRSVLDQIEVLPDVDVDTDSITVSDITGGEGG